MHSTYSPLDFFFTNSIPPFYFSPTASARSHVLSGVCVFISQKFLHFTFYTHEISRDRRDRLHNTKTDNKLFKNSFTNYPRFHIRQIVETIKTYSHSFLPRPISKPFHFAFSFNLFRWSAWICVRGKRQCIWSKRSENLKLNLEFL